MKHIPYSLSITIPAFNEEGSIERVAMDALAAAKSVTKDYEVLLLDDGSTDTTGEIADRLAKKYKEIRVIHHLHNQGFSGAIKTCYRNAKKDLVFLAPADGQVDVKDIKLFLNNINNADVIVGYRTNNPEHWKRKINSYLFHGLYRLFFGIPLKEISTSILWRKKVLNSVDITSSSRSAMIEPEVIYRAWKKGFRFCEIGIPYYPRLSGKPNGANPMMILATIKEMLRLWWALCISKPHDLCTPL